MARRSVAGIQRHLEAIYHLDVGHRAEDFLIGHAELEAVGGAGPGGTGETG